MCAQFLYCLCRVREFMVTEMLLGASTIAFREQPLGRDVLTAMRDAGVESVELTDYHPEFQYHDLKPFETIRDLL